MKIEAEPDGLLLAETVPAKSSPPSPTRCKNDDCNALHDLIAGGVAGCAGTIVGHPLDSIKVRMQMMTSSPSSMASTGQRLRLQSSTHHYYGSLWKGIGAPLAMAAVANASIFLTYGGSIRIWDKHFLDSSKAVGHTNSNSIMKTSICGGIAGIVSSLIICPTEHIKTRLQTQKRMMISPSSSSSCNSTSIHYKNSFHATKYIYSNHGIAGLYRGFCATMARQGPGFAVYFGAYDILKEYAINNIFGTQHEVLASITAGGIAGSLSWAAAYPTDLIKSRVQAMPFACSTTERSMAYVTKEVVRLHGWKALYRGVAITILRAFPVNGIIFPTYELTLSILRNNSK